MTGHPPVHVLVAVPARDEADRLEGCLTSISAALDVAASAGMLGDRVVAVGAHRCGDDTVAVARSTFASLRSHIMRADTNRPPTTRSRTLVWTWDQPARVGEVRSRLVRHAMEATGLDPATTWLFSTDADTQVPPSWIVDGLILAQRAGAMMIVGLVDLDVATIDPRVANAHDQLIRRGIRPDGSHEHVYAANLAVRLDVFLKVGGFPAVQHGEEHALLAAVTSAGYACASSTTWRVTTSGRTHGRADGGLAGVLHGLANQLDVQPPRPTTKERTADEGCHLAG